MSKATALKMSEKENGRVDLAAALAALDRARAHIKKHGSPFKGMTGGQILARIKKTRYEIFEERFAPRSRQQ